MSFQPNMDAAGAAYKTLRDESQKRYDLIAGDEASTVMVGAATCGIAAGAGAVTEAFKNELSALGVEANVFEVGCMGHCYAEPMAVVKRPGYPPFVYHLLDPGKVRRLVRKFFSEEDPYFDIFLGALGDGEDFPTMSMAPRYGHELRRLLKRCGVHDPRDIGQAIALGAYEGFFKSLELGAENVIDQIKSSGLRGLGGAGFLTWRKWTACKEQQADEKYIICNADEGDPGAFMDRTILESDTHAVIAGMMIGGLAVGAEKGRVYVRSEYPLAVERLHKAIDDARAANLLGENILGSGFAFDIRVVMGAGAFVCGEETALLASIEGRRGTPRTKPPFPAESGLWGKPTVINNVKTFANVSAILDEGPEKFAAIGTEASKGTAVFALAGKILNTGLVEVPMGTTLRDVVFDIGGGVPSGKEFKAVQIGGPSGGCVPASLLDTPVDFDALAEAGSMMGSGGMVILDEDNCMVETTRFFLEFLQRESCGKCTFCRIGTKHMLDLLEKIVEGKGEMADIDNLKRLAEDLKAGSLCNLGKTAANPVLTTLRFFRHEYEAHILEQKCPAGECQALTAFYILPDKCARGCDACVGSCPTEAIWTHEKRRTKIVEQDKCVNCGSCLTACPPEYDAIVKISPLRDVPPSEPRPNKEKSLDPD